MVVLGQVLILSSSCSLCILFFFLYKLISNFLESSWVQYQATGRGFVVRHIKFSENYRLYSRSHFVKGFVVSDLGSLYQLVK